MPELPQTPPHAIEAACRLIAGEAGALEDLVRIYQPLLLEGRVKPIPDDLEPEDFAQEAWLRFLMRRQRLRRAEEVGQCIEEAATYAQWHSAKGHIILICGQPAIVSRRPNRSSMGLRA